MTNDEQALECVHRGDQVVRQEECTLCGGRRRVADVYACAIHGECTLRRTRAGSGGPPNCLGCPERTTADGQRPPHAPRKLILHCRLSPGDVLTLTAAVESLHRLRKRKFLTDVRTPCPAIWEHNPHLTPIADDDPAAEHLEMHYPTIDRSNQTPETFLAGYTAHLARLLDERLWLTTNRPHLYLSHDEQHWIGQVEEQLGRRVPYWLVSAGTKRDFPAKQWPGELYQKVVDHFVGRLQFVQIGSAEHRHPCLRGVFDLRGKTDLRQLVRLAYHAAGGLGPVTLLQHLCAAWEKPYVCLVGGREPVSWVSSYPRQHTLHTIGGLACCRAGACWKSRVVPLGDGEPHDRSLCEDPVAGTFQLPVGRCMAQIRPAEVIACVERLAFSG